MEKNYISYILTFLMVVVNGSHQMCLDMSDMTVCVGNKFIKGIPEKVDTNMTKICFMQGENSDIPKNAFILLPNNMDALYLNLTNIFTISEGAFNKLENLTTLGLYGNRISKLEKQIFQQLRNVKTLDLSGNDISKISNINFFGLDRLENLQIVHNYIKNIKNDDFNNFKNLKYLDLSINYIESIGDNTFSNLPNLEILNLNFNKINNVEDGAFDGLIKLKILKLKGNFLDCIPTQKITSSFGLIVDLIDNQVNCDELKSEILPSNNVTVLC